MKGLAVMVWIGIAGVASIALFHIKFQVEQLQNELNTLNKQILEEQKTVHVLQAEWGYLTRPKHIETLANRLMPHLKPPTTHQVGDIEQLKATTRKPSAISAARVVSPLSARGSH